MAVSITVYPLLDPRVISIDDPQTEATVQDIINAVRDWEDSMDGQNFPFMIDATGKEALDDVTSVGITATLQNAQIRFAARNEVHSTGTATANDTKGVTLTDGAADFTAEGSEIGDTVFNSTTGAMETVTAVGTTTLTCFPLVAGSRQDWQIGDAYSVYHHELCNISGGNLVAVDSNGDSMEPIFKAPNVNLVKTSSSSGTINTLELQELQAVLESHYPRGISGNNWFVSPYSGDDGFSGTKEKPFATFAAAQAVASDGDGIHFLADDPGGETVLVEHISIDKRLMVRGPGDQFVVAPTTDLNDGYKYSTVYVGADYTEVSGFTIKTGPGTTRLQRGLKLDANWVYGHNLVIEDAHDTGIYIQNVDNLWLKDIRISNPDNYGIYTQASAVEFITLENFHVYDSGNQGIYIRSGTNVFLIGWNVIRGCVGEGLSFHADVDNLYIDPSYISVGNGAADTLPASSKLHYYQDKFKERIWQHEVETYSAEETLRILASVAAGKTSIVDLGGGLATVVFRDLADTKDRIEADMDGSERTGVTIDET